MKIEYQNKPIDWDNAGIMPPQDLIEKGFQPGYKPPAEYFNAILHNTSEAIKEIQEKTIEMADSSSGRATGSTIIDVTCTYTAPDTETDTSGEYTITTDVDLQSEDFFCLRFVAPNDYVKDTVFTIGSETYAAVNAGFKANELVILNFDVSQKKCFFVSGGGTGGSDTITPYITDAVCTYASSVYTLTPNKDVGNADYFCLRFKAPRDCYYGTETFKIGETTYTAKNIYFNNGDIVILNFDVSQQKCFSTYCNYVSVPLVGGTLSSIYASSGFKYVVKIGVKEANQISNRGSFAVACVSSAEAVNRDINIEVINNATDQIIDTFTTKNVYFAKDEFVILRFNKNTKTCNGSNGKKMSIGIENDISLCDNSLVIGSENTITSYASSDLTYGALAVGLGNQINGVSSSVSGSYAVAVGVGNEARAVNFVCGKFCKTPTQSLTASGDLFVVGNGAGTISSQATATTRSNAFRVAMNGNVYGTKSYTASGADYAEMFEWADGDHDNEDRRGLFVTLDGEKIRPASADDDYILGVVSATPSVVADAQTDDWGKKWKTDIFGERLLDENGAWILNENFREEDNESYVSRLDRKEWAAVGLVGKLIVVDDGTCEVNGYCVPTNGGIATKSETGYRVLSRVDENHIKVLIK